MFFQCSYCCFGNVIRLTVLHLVFFPLKVGRKAWKPENTTKTNQNDLKWPQHKAVSPDIKRKTRKKDRVISFELAGLGKIMFNEGHSFRGQMMEFPETAQKSIVFTWVLWLGSTQNYPPNNWPWQWILRSKLKFRLSSLSIFGFNTQLVLWKTRW